MHLALAERYSADWEDLDKQHKARTSDPGRLYLNKSRDLNGIQSAWDAMNFHRNQVSMYAAAIQAEEAAASALGIRGGSQP